MYIITVGTFTDASINIGGATTMGNNVGKILNEFSDRMKKAYDVLIVSEGIKEAAVNILNIEVSKLEAKLEAEEQRKIDAKPKQVTTIYLTDIADNGKFEILEQEEARRKYPVEVTQRALYKNTLGVVAQFNEKYSWSILTIGGYVIKRDPTLKMVNDSKMVSDMFFTGERCSNGAELITYAEAKEKHKNLIPNTEVTNDRELGTYNTINNTFHIVKLNGQRLIKG